MTNEERTVSSLAELTDAETAELVETARPVVTGGADDQADRVGTAVVCLDCGPQADGHGYIHDGAVVTTYLRKSGADEYVRRHIAERDHRTVTVPGWPRRRDAIALAKVHVESTRIGRPGDDQCTAQLRDGERCALKADHLGGCE